MSGRNKRPDPEKDAERVLRALSPYRYDRGADVKRSVQGFPMKLQHVSSVLCHLRDEGLVESMAIRSGRTGWRRTALGDLWLRTGGELDELPRPDRTEQFM